jgi:hypothetical protein
MDGTVVAIRLQYEDTRSQEIVRILLNDFRSREATECIPWPYCIIEKFFVSVTETRTKRNAASAWTLASVSLIPQRDGYSAAARAALPCAETR